MFKRVVMCMSVVALNIGVMNPMNSCAHERFWDLSYYSRIRGNLQDATYQGLHGINPGEFYEVTQLRQVRDERCFASKPKPKRSYRDVVRPSEDCVQPSQSFVRVVVAGVASMPQRQHHQ